jgi:hypothetical protein
MSKEANPSRGNPVKSSERPERLEKPEQKVSPAAEEKSPLGNFHYVALMEMNDTECEAWYNFIRLEGNEDALRHLNQQLETVRWRLEDDLSTFDLDLEHPVTEQTAREMIRLDLNHSCPHRMFCGKLETIDLKLKPEYKNLKKMEKVFDVLGEGGIENFIEDEYVDPRDMADSNESESESESSTGSSSTESEKAPSPAGKKPANKKKQLIEVPRYAKAKKHHK